MIRVILLAAIILGAAIFAAYTLTQLDQIVHGQLYNYGLTFSFDWANPYWNLLRVTLILLDVIAVSTVISLALTLQKYRALKRKLSGKKTRTQKSTPISSRLPAIPSPSPQQKFEKPQIKPLQETIPIPIPTPSTSRPETTAAPPAPLPDEPSGLSRCSHCSKAFSQPLRMLDFQGDRPRIINVCPFCNEILSSTQTRKDTNQTTENPAARPVS